MTVKRIVFIFILCLNSLLASAQADSAVAEGSPVRKQAVSSYRLKRQQVRDSLSLARARAVASYDSLIKAPIAPPQTGRPNKFLDSLVKANTVDNMDIEGWKKKFKTTMQASEYGEPLAKGPMWIVLVTFFIIISFAVLRYSFPGQVSLLAESFFSDRVLSQINKEEDFFNSWPFIFYYILFSFTIGLSLYEAGRQLHFNALYEGFGLYARLSVLVLLLYTAKTMFIKLLAFIFNLQKPGRVYNSILLIAYFNFSLVCLPLTIAMVFAPDRYAVYFIVLLAIAGILIFIIQLIRALKIIMTKYRFQIFYLFIYLCALEICPLLVLWKALRF